MATTHDPSVSRCRWACNVVGTARFFREITTKRIRRGSFTSVPDLIAAICAYIDQHNENPMPYIWTAEADTIIEKRMA